MTTYTISDTIPNGSALAAGVQINQIDVVGLQMPAGWDAAAITIQQSSDGTNWNEIYDQNGNNLALTTAAARYIVLPPWLLPGCNWLRVRSGTAGVPVNQTAARTLIWYARNYGR